MISIVTAVANKNFAWQMGLFWAQHKKIYGEAAPRLAMSMIARKNFTYDNYSGDSSFDIENNLEIPRMYFDGACDRLGDDINNVPLNIQYGLMNLLPNLDPEETIEVLDCDLFHLAPRQKVVEHGVIYADPIYEKWHLYSKTVNNHVMAPFVKTQKYYNGGFVPLICTVKTMSEILPVWTHISISILKMFGDKNIKWWNSMYGLCVACEILKIKMIDTHDMYVPPVNTIEGKTIAHYSVDNQWARKKTKNPVGSDQDPYTRAIQEYIEAQKKPPIS